MGGEKISLYFSDVFNVQKHQIHNYGAFNVSLLTDLPLFIDPFLLFNSPKPEYQELHESIIEYLVFLRDMSSSQKIDDGLLHEWFFFSEVKQNWLGFCEMGNAGRGLAEDFAIALQQNLSKIFQNFGQEALTKGSHLEKLCLIKEGVGKDSISDFTTNLIKEYLLNYTQKFAKECIDPKLLQEVSVNRVRFNYKTKTWVTAVFYLPIFNGDYVLLTPKDMLTKDDIWINKDDLIDGFYLVPNAIPNEQLRSRINNYFMEILPKRPTRKEEYTAISKVLREFPELIDYYIKTKEDTGDEAVKNSLDKVSFSDNVYVEQFGELVGLLSEHTKFYLLKGDTSEEAYKRILYLKDVIENKGGWRIFYHKGDPIRREDDLHILYILTWYATPSDVSHEVNNGRGPVDFKISRGSQDKSLVEFKLASNPQLKQNLKNQLEIYQKASGTEKGYKVIIYFTAGEHEKVIKILNELKLTDEKNIILIDARADNKPSASKAKSH